MTLNDCNIIAGILTLFNGLSINTARQIMLAATSHLATVQDYQSSAFQAIAKVHSLDKAQFSFGWGNRDETKLQQCRPAARIEIIDAAIRP